MKKKHTYLLCSVALLLFQACKKEGLMTYNASDNIYFNYIVGANPATNTLGFYSDSSEFSFAFAGQSTKDTLLPVPVKVTGVAHNEDRGFSLSIDPASTAIATTHYELPASFVMHAGKVIDTVLIKFKRTADLKTKPVALIMRLMPNDQFATRLQVRPRQVNDPSSAIEAGDSVKMLSFKINVSDKLSAGPYWGDYEYYFGSFSEKKVRLMNQIVGMPLDFWSVPNNSQEQMYNTFYYGGFTSRYLSDQAFAGKIIFEEDGITPMTMGWQFR